MQLKRNLMLGLLTVLVWTTVNTGASSEPQTPAPAKKPCRDKLADCPDEGCGGQFDPNLNKLKNIRSDDRPATARALTWMSNLASPKKFTEGGDRKELTALGEGQKITVVAYLLVAKAELSGESCNCGLQTPEETDNHLVLVTKETVDKFPISNNAAKDKTTFHSRESKSQTAEFTPRVRLTHPNFTQAKVQPLIDATPQKALWSVLPALYCLTRNTS